MNNDTEPNQQQTERQVSRKYKLSLEKRTSAILSIQFHEKKVSQMRADSSKMTALSTLPLLEEAFERFKDMNRFLEDCSEYKLEDLKPPSVEIEHTYILAISKIKEIASDSFDSSLLNSTQHHKPKSSGEVKLPQISIPIFSGDYLEWTPFYDSFTGLIDKDDIMCPSTKFQYLKSFLSGSALSTVNRLPVTDCNYKLAWQLLKDRFHNKRAIVNSCLRTFMNQTPIKMQPKIQCAV